MNPIDYPALHHLISQFDKEISECREFEYVTIKLNKHEDPQRDTLKIDCIISPSIYPFPAFTMLLHKANKKENSYHYTIVKLNPSFGIIHAATLKEVISLFFERLKTNLVLSSEKKILKLWMAYYSFSVNTENTEEIRLWKELEQLPLDYQILAKSLGSILERRNDLIGKARMWFLLTNIRSKLEDLTGKLKAREDAFYSGVDFRKMLEGVST